MEKNYREDNLALIIKAEEWRGQPDREHRLITSKVVPKFKSREEEVRYFEKRLAARAFCERGYGLNQVKEEYSQNGGPVNMEKKRYKTVSTGFISESYRKF